MLLPCGSMLLLRCWLSFLLVHCSLRGIIAWPALPPGPQQRLCCPGAGLRACVLVVAGRVDVSPVSVAPSLTKARLTLRSIWLVEEITRHARSRRLGQPDSGELEERYSFASWQRRRRRRRGKRLIHTQTAPERAEKTYTAFFVRLCRHFVSISLSFACGPLGLLKIYEPSR